MADRERDVSENVRAIIRHVMSLTHETYVDLGAAIKMRPALVGRRQSGKTQWSVDELGLVADHWRLQAWCLLTDVEHVLQVLDEDRVTELRAVKGFAPLHFKPPTVVAA